MALIKVIKGNQEVQQLELSRKKIYKVGRGSENDIVLDQEPGISRLHFELKFEDGGWQLKSESRYGLLYLEDQVIDKMNLRDSARFRVPPYEFEFTDSTYSAHSQTTDNLDAGEKTMVGGQNLKAYLKFLDHRGLARNLYKLEGDSWVAGRDTPCSIFVDHQKMSRRHFEIKLQNGQYLIRDLQSSNGTHLNGRPLSSEDWTPLQSYDSISVSDLLFQFELRDPNFEKKVQQIDPGVIQPVAFSDRGSDIPVENFEPHLQNQFPPLVLKFKENKNFKLAVYAMAGILVLGGLFLIPAEKPEKSIDSANTETKKEKSFAALPANQKEYVQQTYITGQQLLMQGKYEMARQEMIKIHQVLPFYEESKQIEEMSELALKTLRDKEDLERKEKDRIQIEEKVQRQVQSCRKNMSANWVLADLDQCLSSVMALNPDHPDISNLKGELERNRIQKSMLEAKNKDYREQVQKLKNQFQKASSQLEKENFALALKEFKQVSELSLPDPEGLKSKAKRQVSSIQSKMSERVASLDKKADQALKSGDLKTAIVSLKSGLEIAPQDEKIKTKLEMAQKDHKKLMQNLYQEGILEESVGEVDAAKGKWKKILDQSYAGEDYYQKSQLKLKKYGL